MSFILCIPAITIGADDAPKSTLSGYIKDATNGETLIGATVYITELETGTQTNVYGFYSITLPPGMYSVQYRYVGYHNVEESIDLTTNQRLDVELNAQQTQLEEIVISGEGFDANVTSTEMSVAEIDIQTIQKLPAFLGEADVLKSIQLLPGVSTVGEGASGFNVRGGSVGQNLVLLDEAPVYNSSHLLGFFSVFNPDAVKDVKLYKGGIPARYGGRLASILDIRMKEGNNKDFGVNGGIGSIFSRVAVEGPLVKDKASFIVAGRRSYGDVFAKLFTDVLADGAALYFYDLTAKANYNINDKNRIYLSGYLGRDKFLFDRNQGFSWGNNTATLRWNHLFNDRLFSNITAYFSDYDYSLAFGENDLDRFEWNSRIRTTTFKPELTYFLSSDAELSFGGELLYYRFDPANAFGISVGNVQDISLDPKYALESALYISNDHKFSDAFSMEYGLRASAFQLMGPGAYFTFGDTIPGERRPVQDSFEAENGETIASYFNLEPRISARLKTGPKSSIKASYNRMAQYLHLISNTVASNPLDVWTPSTNNIAPQLGDQYALGYFKNFGAGNDYEASLEVYYRPTQNQIDYIDGAELLINELLEGDLLSGRGRAYGMELYVKKNTGRLTGWLSYTLGRSELKVEGINNGEWYDTRFDQRHNLKLAGFYDLNERLVLGANFSFLSGTPTTFPTSRYVVQGYLTPHNAFENRNNIRIPSFHRLDLSLTWYGKKYNRKGELRKNDDYFVFSIYNAYARRNPFSIYFTQGSERSPAGQPIDSKAMQVSIIGSVLPAISYNFSF
jgi:hypothetical protein